MPEHSQPTLFFSVGDPSGDQHAANLIRALHSQQHGFRAVGYGGPKMQAAGCNVLADLTSLAVMGLGPALAKLPQAAGLLLAADRYFRETRPDAVVLVDFPGFNWWVARCAKRRGIPVYYYCPPQIWAWANWRVKKMRRLVDHVLCTLPFEAAWFNERGCHATYVGHPYFDDARLRTHDAEFVHRERYKPGQLVTILPGSRTREVKLNLPCFLQAAAQVRAAVPSARFAVAAFNSQHADLARSLVVASGLPVDIHVGRTQELMHLAHCCLAVSGSVSLELLYHTRPTVVHYYLPHLAYVLYRPLMHVPYVSLVNLISTGQLQLTDWQPYFPGKPGTERVLFPEYPTWEDRSSQLAAHTIEWLTDAARHSERVAELAELKARLCHGGASRKAAEYLLTTLAHRSDNVPRPHFLPGATTTGRKR